MLISASTRCRLFRQELREYTANEFHNLACHLVLPFYTVSDDDRAENLAVVTIILIVMNADLMLHRHAALLIQLSFALIT